MNCARLRGSETVKDDGRALAIFSKVSRRIRKRIQDGKRDEELTQLQKIMPSWILFWLFLFFSASLTVLSAWAIRRTWVLPLMGSLVQLSEIGSDRTTTRPSRRRRRHRRRRRRQGLPRTRLVAFDKSIRALLGRNDESTQGTSNQIDDSLLSMYKVSFVFSL